MISTEILINFPFKIYEGCGKANLLQSWIRSKAESIFVQDAFGLASLAPVLPCKGFFVLEVWSLWLTPLSVLPSPSLQFLCYLLRSAAMAIVTISQEGDRIRDDVLLRASNAFRAIESGRNDNVRKVLLHNISNSMINSVACCFLAGASRFQFLIYNVDY